MMSLDRIKRRDVLTKLLPGMLDALLQQLDAPGERFAHHAQAHDLAKWLDAQPAETQRKIDALLCTMAPDLCACATQGSAEAWMARQHQRYRSQLPEGRATATAQARLSTARETITQALARLRRPIYPDAGHRGMVLLGPSGSGKTAALLQAWCDAYDQWIADPDQPVPVYLTGALLQHTELHGLSRPIQAVAALEGFDATDLLWLPQPVLLLLDGLDDLPRPARQAIARWAISIPSDERITIAVAMRDDAWDAALSDTLRPLLPFDLLPREVTDPQDVSRLRVGSRWWCEALDMEFVWVPPGSFFMGATHRAGPGYDYDALDSEAPVHAVTISRGFWLGRFPVTNTQIRAFVEETGAAVGSLQAESFDGPDQPAAEIDWYDAMRFCAWASRQTGLCITLPTEAEWEYAARGTDGRKFPWGDQPLDPSRAWFSDLPPKQRHATAPVGERPGGVGPFGAEEQIGNVWEWCADPAAAYPGGFVMNPGRDGLHALLEELAACPDLRREERDAFREALERLCEHERMLRGGSWEDLEMRAVSRCGRSAGTRERSFGVRVVVRPMDNTEARRSTEDTEGAR